VPDQTPDVEFVDAGDRASRTATPALLAEPEHLNSIEPLGEFRFRAHYHQSL
jgi:hypothetical protein